MVHLWYTTAKFSCSLLQLFPNLESSFNANVYKGIIRICLQSVEVGCKARSALLTRRSQVGLLPGPPYLDDRRSIGASCLPLLVGKGLWSHHLVRDVVVGWNRLPAQDREAQMNQAGAV